jgi:site-specific recombinase XerD
MVTDDAVRALLRACEGRSFIDRRDIALVRLLLDSGARRSEVAALTLDMVDLREKTATVLGKGRRPRIITFGSRTALAIDRYLRERRMHRDAERSELWLGHRGPVTSDGIAQILERRCAQAGLSRIGAHAFRHLFAHSMLNSGNAGDGPDAAGRLAEPSDGRPLRCRNRDRPSDRGLPEAGAERPVLVAPSAGDFAANLNHAP